MPDNYCFSKTSEAAIREGSRKLVVWPFCSNGEISQSMRGNFLHTKNNMMRPILAVQGSQSSSFETLMYMYMYAEKK